MPNVPVVIDAFEASLVNGDRPDLYKIGQWLTSDRIKEHITREDYDRIVSLVLLHYGLENEDRVAEALAQNRSKILGPTFVELLRQLDFKGWIADYIDHLKDTECPTIFNFLTSLSLVGATLKRKIYIKQGPYSIWPATQVFLLGPTGVRKTTAAVYGADVIGQVATSLQDGDIALFNNLGDSGTAEGVYRSLARQTLKTGAADGFICVSELATFFGKQEYNSTLVEAMTDLFDSPSYKKRVLAKETVEVKNVALSFVGCTNLEFASSSMPRSLFGGGTMGRVLAAYVGEKEKLVPIPRDLPEEEQNELRYGLHKISLVSSGRVYLESDAVDYFSERYRWQDSNKPLDERMDAFWERRHVHLLRMGMLLAATEIPNEISIQERHLRIADTVLSWLTDRLPEAYDQLSETKFAKLKREIKRTLRTGGALTEKELRTKMSSKLERAKDLEEALRDLSQMGEIKEVKVQPWRGAKGWKLK